LRRHRIVDLPRKAGLSYDRSMGEMARRLHRKRALYRGLRPVAAATLEYIGRRVKQLSGGHGSLTVTSALRDHRYQRLLLVRNSAATAGYSLHTTGYAFDIARTYRGPRQAAAFQFVLERLQSRGAIEWIREPDAIHIAVMPRGRILLHPAKSHVAHVKPQKHHSAKRAKAEKKKPHVARKKPHAVAKREGVFSMFARVFGSLRF
jgi:hypothetical protein